MGHPWNISLEERLTKKIDSSGECWVWIGSRNQHGYGRITMHGRSKGPSYAHRVAYEHWVGTIPQGHEIDHLCNNRSCVRPDHLEPVTREENLRRAGCFKT